MNKSTNLILIGILVCMIIIAFRPIERQVMNTTVESHGYHVIYLGNDRAAVFDLDRDSGKYGEAAVYEITDSGLRLLYKDNIGEDLRN
ncbi:MAG: hypothetical protein C6W59_06165 [Paenibacillaceae bacterium]|nr:MAG: hypothetical protein C6W59_06165 [Paenibacillaceae bacterium]